jgi:hypothetical protein
MGDDFVQRAGGGRHPAVLPLDHWDALVLEPLAGVPKVVWVVHDRQDPEVAGQVAHEGLNLGERHRLAPGPGVPEGRKAGRRAESA